MTTISDFKDFVSLVKPIETYSECSPQLIEKYLNILPEVITNSWAKHGFQKFSEGFLWTTNPDEYRYLPELFTKVDSSEAHVFLRTAFGDFIFYYKGNIYNYSVVTSLLLKIGPSIETLLDFDFAWKDSLNNIYFFNIYKKALKKIGTLTEDEIYAYIPALQMGGQMDIKNLQKQNMKSYLMMIADFSQ